MFERNAYGVQMSFDVPDAERRIAEKAEEQFEELSSKLKLAMEHLDYMYIPFKTHNATDSSQLVENQVMFTRFKVRAKRNFDRIRKKAKYCLALMSEFRTDTATEEMMKSFVANIESVERQVNTFLSLFSNLNSPDFRDNVISTIDAIRKTVSQLRQMINDRILDHIDTNILAKNWISEFTGDAENRIKEKTPLLIELYKERQKAIQKG